MNTLRLARVAARARPTRAVRNQLQTRSYADAVSDKINLTLALPHQVRSSSRRPLPPWSPLRTLKHLLTMCIR